MWRLGTELFNLVSGRRETDGGLHGWCQFGEHTYEYNLVFVVWEIYNVAQLVSVELKGNVTTW